MLGTSTMQNLINVHFRTNSQLSNLLMRDSDQAMLHFVYNSQLVGAFVCHDGRKGEWVLQILFFPPYQTMNDFSLENVRGMVSGLDWVWTVLMERRTRMWFWCINHPSLDYVVTRCTTLCQWIEQYGACWWCSPCVSAGRWFWNEYRVARLAQPCLAIGVVTAQLKPIVWPSLFLTSMKVIGSQLPHKMLH